MELKYPELLERLKERGVSQRAAAKAVGIDPAGMSRKLRGTQPLYLSEAEKLAGLLGIRTTDAFCRVFFPECCRKKGGGDGETIHQNEGGGGIPQRR